jgi:alpha-mannosidase
MADKKVTVHMIGNAHIDPVWLWKWQEGYAETLATCKSALDRMDETPDFRFTRADAATFRWIEESNPEMFEQIRQRVAEGRWSLVGGWWEQPDCNVPSGESFVRHALYGKRYFREKFGVDVKVGYNVDSFGHSGGLPQILKLSGIDSYLFFRPQQHEKQLPGMLFHWQGPDGSSVLACRPADHYCTWFEDFEEIIKHSLEAITPGSSHTVCFYGVGNHGGGPTKANLAHIKAINEREEDFDLVLSTMDDFLAASRAEAIDYPVVADDLQHHAIGCYSAHSEIKRLNRKMENLLVTSEKFATTAHVLLGRPYPHSVFSEGWKTLLFNQFHDILAGTCLPEAYDDVRDELGYVSHTASHELNATLQSLAQNIDTQGEGRPFIVFNPHPWPVESPVIYDENWQGLADQDGNAVQTQPVNAAYEHTGHRKRNVFLADLPPFGYRLYRIMENQSDKPETDLSISADSLENKFWKISINSSTGWITGIWDKTRNFELLSAPIAPVVMDDPSDTWSHGVVSFREEVGRFCDAEISVAESGPVRVVLRIKSRFGNSTLTQDLALYSNRELIDCRCLVDWHEKHKVLKLAYPFAVDEAVSTYDTAYAATVRPTDGAENPGQMWVDVSGRLGDQSYGIALINDSKYGFDVLGSELRMTVLRSPIYAFHEPRQVEPGKQYKYMEQGEQEFTWSLLPHSGSWNEAEVVKQAVIVNAPPVVVETYQHDGPWPGRMSWLELPGNVNLGAMKLAEDEDVPVMRLYEHSGTGIDLTAACFGREVKTVLRGFELKTLKLLSQRTVDVDVLEYTLTR